MCEYKILLLCILTFLVHVPPGNSLKCGVCTSELHSKCRDPSKVTKFEECNKHQAFVCRTIEYLDNKNTVHIARGCSAEKDDGNNGACSKERLQPYVQVNKCETCNTDFCNAHPGLGVKEDVTTPNPGGSVAVRSSLCIVIMCLFINLYKKNYA